MTSIAGSSAEQHHPRRGLAPIVAHAVDEEARQRDDQQDLAELGRLEVEERAARSTLRRRAWPSPSASDQR